jgi:oligosaccharyltransferase complex subunit delta (ribophorin II)
MLPCYLHHCLQKTKFDHQSHKDIPVHLLDASELELSLALGSFGSTGAMIPLGNVVPIVDPTVKAAHEKQREKELGEGAVVYKPKPEIRHVFRADPTNPPKAITLAFLLAVIVGYVGLFAAVSAHARNEGG